jgi:hypothetical protein
MELNCHTYLHNFVYNRFGGKKPVYKINRIEKDYFKTLSIRMEDKSNKRITDIQRRILNDISKNIYNKKYQIKGLTEYEFIKKWSERVDTKGYELLWHHDETGLQMNKLDKIIEGDYICDKPMIFINKKSPVIYCYFTKKNI